MNPEERLVDALLREQARKREADEKLLAEIEAALDRGSRNPVPVWRRIAPLSIAALVALSAAAVFHSRQDFAPDLAVNETRRPAPEVTRSAAGRADVPAAPFPDGEAGIGDRVAGKSEALVGEPAEPATAMAAESRLEAQAAPRPQALELQEQTAGLDSADAEPGRIGRVDEMGDAFAPAPAEADPFAAGGMVLPRRGGEMGDGSAGRDRAGRVPQPGGFGNLPEDGLNRENYGRLVDQPWKAPLDQPLSTFSVDVDTASYTNLRRMILEGRPVPPDAVRIEECVNYFDYDYEGPRNEGPFAVGSLLATCPWNSDHLLARVAIKGREVEVKARPASNLVFLIDVSGSMQSPDKLPLLKRAIRVLIGQLDERDRVGMVVYAGSEGVVLPPTQLDEAGRSKAIAALGKLESGGSTNGGAGLARAYRMAAENMVAEGVNRVILATDGDFNVGTTGQGELVSLVKEGAAKAVSLSVVGFGAGNLNDAMLEAVTNEGDGNYFYIGDDAEAERVFLRKLAGTLVTIAKDVKIQVEFNPGKVRAYRLIGYANRILRDQDFNDDQVDAGDIGAGHTVTAFYEIVPQGAPAPRTGEGDGLRYQRPAELREVVPSDDWLTLKLRYKHPAGEESQLIETPVKGEPLAWQDAGNDFRTAAAVALFGMKLRGIPEVKDVPWAKVEEVLNPALADDPQEQRAEFLKLLRKME